MTNAAPDDLRRDVRLMGDLLGRVLVESVGEDLLADVERLRAATAALRTDPTDAHRQAVVDVVGSLDLDRAEQVARAFTIYFQLINIAEERSRVRRLADRSRTVWPLPNSMPAAVAAIRDEEGDATLNELLDRLEIHPVLTAHPTEARRRAVVETLKAIAEELSLLDDPRLSRWDERECHRRLLERIEILWETDQLRAQHPTPLDEVRAVMALFDETIFWAAPAVYREMDHALAGAQAGLAPPSFRPFLRWGSWVGGDRDGNPSVTADITRESARIQSEHALQALEDMTRWLGSSLSASTREIIASDELLEALRADAHVFPEEAAALERWMPDTPHRRMLLLAAERLSATRTGSPGAYDDPQAFIDDLRVVQASLAAGGAARLAYGELQHLIWQAETFGFHLASLDVRQHSSVHRAVLAELGVDADDLAALDHLAGHGWPDGTGPTSEQGHEALATLRAMADIQRRHGPRACGRYVVSFTRSAADILAVHALGRLAVPDGMSLAVLPLLESREDLQAATSILDDLVALPWFSRWLDERGRHLEVMLGYSDSAKEAGMLAANLALYRAQGELADWARDNRVELTLFHGRGGALGRGGGPTNRAIWAQAPGSVAGRFQVTEQGEVIFARYANPQVAHRHLEQVTSAVLLNSTPAAVARAGGVRSEDPLVRMGEASERAWRDLVEMDGFAAFFADATPLAEIEALRIASRPSRRSRATDVTSLRAIPWVFAWAQCRVNLPGWYGLGSGLEAVAEGPGGTDTLREMYDQWPFFTTLLDNAALSLLKADLPIAQLYLERGGRPDLAAAIEREYRLTERMVLEASGQPELLATATRLRTDIELRNPYVDALSFLQLRWLPQARRDDLAPDDVERIQRLVHLTINGVAAGLQNTG